MPLDGPDCKAASASQADKPNVWLRRSLCTVPASRMQAFPGPERRAGVGEQGICRQPGTLLEMSNLETNGARSEIGLERLNCIQCVRFFVGSPLQYCCVLMLMIGALKFDIWLPKPAQHYSHFVYPEILVEIRE